MALDLQGCRTLVTGASSGIGAGLAEALAERGAVVGICARRAELLSEVVERCMEHSPDSRMWVVNLADPDAVDRLAVDVLDAFGGVDLLVNNAGIPKRRTLTALDIDTITAVMHINYLSPMRLTMDLLPQMLARGRAPSSTSRPSPPSSARRARRPTTPRRRRSPPSPRRWPSTCGRPASR